MTSYAGLRLLAVLPGLVGNSRFRSYFDCVQIGWVTGPPALINAIAKAHQFLVFTVPSNLQRAVAHGLDNESSFFT